MMRHGSNSFGNYTLYLDKALNSYGHGKESRTMITICFRIKLRTLLGYATLVCGKERDWVLDPHRTVVGDERQKKIASLILGIRDRCYRYI